MESIKREERRYFFVACAKVAPAPLFFLVFVLFYTFHQHKTLASHPDLTWDSDALIVEARYGDSDIASYIGFARHFYQHKNFSTWYSALWPPGMAVAIAAVFSTVGTDHYPLHMMVLWAALWACALCVWYHALGFMWPWPLRALVLNLIWLSPFFRDTIFGEGALLSESPSCAFFCLSLAFLVLGLKSGRHLYFIWALVCLSTAAHFRAVFDSLGFFLLFVLFFFFGLFVLKRHRNEVMRMGWQLLFFLRKEKKSILLTISLLVLIQSIVWVIPISQLHRWEKAEVILYYYSVWCPSVRIRYAGIWGLLKEAAVVFLLVNLIIKKEDNLVFRMGRTIRSGAGMRWVKAARSHLRIWEGGRAFLGTLGSIFLFATLEAFWRFHLWRELGVATFTKTFSREQSFYWWNPKLVSWAVTGNTPCLVDPVRCQQFADHSINGEAFWGYVTFLSHPLAWYKIKLRHLDTLLFGCSWHEAFSMRWSYGIDGIVFFFIILFLFLFCVRWLAPWRKVSDENFFSLPSFLFGLVVLGFFIHQFVVFTLMHFEARYLLPLRVFGFFGILSALCLSKFPKGTTLDLSIKDRLTEKSDTVKDRANG